MPFTSIAFLIFFPTSVAIFFALPFRFRSPFLLLASYLFYAWVNPIYLLVLIASTLIDYLAGIYMGGIEDRHRRRPILLLSLILNLGLLFTFKYLNFSSEMFTEILNGIGIENGIPLLQIILPVGISFYTFQTMGYSIEVYQGTMQAEPNIIRFSLFVAFFPKLISGPIERAAHLLPQFDKIHRFIPDRVLAGLQRILWGAFKKLVIADRLAVLVATTYDNPTAYEGIPLIIATYLFAYQIYCDFSGYVDMAIGAAQVLGFEMVENFARPYAARSITEFWRRWHITLSTWFRIHLFSPLSRMLLKRFGRDRGALVHTIVNLITMAMIGLWHGANWTFLAWGLLHGIYLVVESRTINIRKKIAAHAPSWLISPVSTMITFHVTLFAWIFFRASSLEQAIIIIRQSFKITELSLGISPIDLLLVVTLILIMELVQFAKSRPTMWLRVCRIPVGIRIPIGLALILMILFLSPFEGQAFLYFQF